MNHLNINTQLELLINSPLEQFEVINIIGVTAPILGYLQLSLTNVGLYLLIVLLVVIFSHYLTSNHGRILPSKWNITQEALYTSIHSMVREQIGPKNEVYFPFIFSLFILILITNFIGMIPYSFTPTSQLIVSLGLSIAIWIGVTIIGFQRHGNHFWSYFVPAGTPLVLVPLLVCIEIISYIARAFSLGIRLMANMTAGHTLLKIISTFTWQILTAGPILFIVGLIPLVLLIALSGLELAIAALQAYVFTILTCSYLKDSIDLH